MSALNSEQRTSYLDALRSGQRRLLAARECGLDPLMVLAESQADAAFAQAIVMAEMEADDEVEDALRMAAISGNVTASLAWLTQRRPDRWSGKPARSSGMPEQPRIDAPADKQPGNDRLAGVRARIQRRLTG